ncbi:hypothetical protein T12_14262, partial [Trichinella patagoniensis]
LNLNCSRQLKLVDSIVDWTPFLVLLFTSVCFKYGMTNIGEYDVSSDGDQCGSKVIDKLMKLMHSLVTNYTLLNMRVKAYHKLILRSIFRNSVEGNMTVYLALSPITESLKISLSRPYRKCVKFVNV